MSAASVGAVPPIAAPGSKGALAGIRVLDCTTFFAAPFAAMLLADFGADVIKIEAPPAGDPSRYRQDDSGYSSGFASVNRNKRSLLIDLKNPASQPILRGLAERSDVIVLNVRPQSRPALGLAYEQLRAINPRLIYLSISGYGESPENLDRPAFDTTAQAVSGLLSLILDDPDREVRITAMLSDVLAGVFGCTGVLAAIAARERTGEGQEVRTSLLQATLAFELINFYTLFAAQVSGWSNPETTVRTAGYVLRGSDGGRFAAHVPPSPEKIWHGFLDALELRSLDEDERFRSKAARAANYPALYRIVADRVATRPRAYWMARLIEREIACAPFNELAEVFDDPIVKGVNMLHRFIDPWGREQKTVGSGIELSRTPALAPRRAPLPGEHNREILHWLGASEQKVSELERLGVLVTGKVKV